MVDTKEVVFQYVKNNSFRVVKVDGAWGGVTPSLDIFMALFSERPSIPDQAIHSVEGDRLSAQPKKLVFGDGQGALVREVEVGLTVDRATAINLIEWLQEKVSALDRIQKESLRADKA